MREGQWKGKNANERGKKREKKTSKKQKSKIRRKEMEKNKANTLQSRAVVKAIRPKALKTKRLCDQKTKTLNVNCLEIP